MQSQLEQQHVYSLASSCVGQAQCCFTGSREHTIWLTILPFLPCKSFPFTSLTPFQINSPFLGTTSPSALVLLVLQPCLVYAIVSLITSGFDSDFVKLLPILLSVMSCRFSLCCLVGGTTGQRRPSACTLLPFVICSILQLLVSLSCRRHHKTVSHLYIYPNTYLPVPSAAVLTGRGKSNTQLAKNRHFFCKADKTEKITAIVLRSPELDTKLQKWLH